MDCILYIIYITIPPDYELIRTSIEKPRYKEKFRVRGYGKITDDSPIFLEIKKKYKGVVYKRRTSLPMSQAKLFLEHGTLPGHDDQIMREIKYFMQFHHPIPQVYLAYDRTAYVSPDDEDLRITIDQNIRSRYHRLELDYDGDCRILHPGKYLMEIKVGNAYPEAVRRGELHPWLTDVPDQYTINHEIDKERENSCSQVYSTV